MRMNRNRTSILACCFSMGMVAVLAPASARADEPSPHPGIGGHVGIATPLVTITSDNTTTISDQFTLAHPIGIGFKLNDKLAIDFETVLNNPIHPRGSTSLVVDPGVVYDLGSVVVGLRLAWKVQANTNFGLIPLVHKGIADLGGGATWFIEAAFPSFINATPDVTAGTTTVDGKLTFEFNVVLHTGIGF
jgi:hypothetical protein